MRLRLILYPEMISFFMAQEPTAWGRQLKRHLSRYFRIEDQEIVVSPEGLVSLEKVFTELKERWLKGKDLPLPFCLAPREDPFFRPGKVYLSPDQAKEIKPVLEKLPFLARLETWRGNVELVLPATEEPPLLFRYRDLFFIGPHRRCFFCGRKWHRSAYCPLLAEKDPLSLANTLLSRPPAAMAQELNRLCAKGHFEDQKILMAAYPYFLPALLISLFLTKAEKWEDFSCKKELSPGGNLFLGLEALLVGDLSSAKKRFLSLEEGRDARIHVGLFFVALREENLSEAFYHLENALSSAKTPLLQAYLALWKGWLLENKGKPLEAEEFYREALKRDPSFWPASLHLAALETKFAPEKALLRLKKLVEAPLALPAFFLEGRLLPLAKEVEDLLLSSYEERQALALSRLTQAEDTLRPLIKILSEEEAQRFEERLSAVREQVYEGGLLGILSADKEAFDLALELQGYLFRRIREVKERLKGYEERLEHLEEFWQRYPYRTAGHPFEEKIKRLREGLNRISSYLRQDPTRSFKKISAEFKRLEEDLAQLVELEKDLRRQWLFRRQLSVFSKTFLILELILFVFFLFLPGIGSHLGLSLYRGLDMATFFAISLVFLVFSLWRALLQKI